MADSHARRYHAKALEGLLRPVEQRVAFAITPVFPLQVGGVGVDAAEPIDLDRVIDDEIDRNEGINPSGLSAPSGRPHFSMLQGLRLLGPREILHQHPCRHERNGCLRHRSATARAPRRPLQ